VWLDWGVWQRIGHLSLIVICGALAYLTALLLTGLRLRHLRGPKEA